MVVAGERSQFEMQTRGRNRLHAVSDVATMGETSGAMSGGYFTAHIVLRARGGDAWLSGR